MAVIAQVFQSNVFQNSVYQQGYGSPVFQKNVFQNNVFDVPTTVIKVINETINQEELERL